MTVIAIDIDSTLYDFCSHARSIALDWGMAGLRGETALEDQEVHALLEGASAPWPEWSSPSELFGLDLWMRILDRTHSPEAILAQEPYPGAVEAIEGWVDAGHRVFFISSRDHDATALATEQWLEQLGLDGPELLCTGRSGSKIPSLIEAEAEVLIDDRAQTLVEFAYLVGGIAVGMRHEYNRALTDLPRVSIVDTWEEVEDVVEHKLAMA